MIDAGINDGDVVVIREQTTADNGDIIGFGRGFRGDVEALSPQGGMIALEAAKSAL